MSCRAVTLREGIGTLLRGAGYRRKLRGQFDGQRPLLLAGARR